MLRSLLFLGMLPTGITCLPQLENSLFLNIDDHIGVTDMLFNSLEELSRVTDISYCVSYPGIQKPFECPSHCDEFPGFELVKTFSTGLLAGDSAGYIALSHSLGTERIIAAFRGTQSLSNAITDISATLRKYPAPEAGLSTMASTRNIEPCSDCSVHDGFYTAWENTRSMIKDDIEALIQRYPNYRLNLVGHSLGGAIATFAALEFAAFGWNPITTTFGGPRVGNRAMAHYIDATFSLAIPSNKSTYRRVTRIDDPIPLLPPAEYGYHSHGGEIYISNPRIPPSAKDLKICTGDEDPSCIAAAKVRFGMPNLLKFLASHMYYFSRLGNCFSKTNLFEMILGED